MMPDETVPAPPTPSRLWTEQLASGLLIFLGLVAFMALFHRSMLMSGARVLTTNDLPAYGWAAVAGVILQLLIHESGTLLAARHFGMPLRFRILPFGAHAAAILLRQPRRPWPDAVVGLAGPLAGALASGLCAGVYRFTITEDDPTGETFLLAMACVGYFYNLFTLIPLLDLEGGWVAPALAPVAWLFGLAGCVLDLTAYFNLVLLGVVCFAIPRFVFILLGRAPRADLACTGRQRWIVAVAYFGMALAFAWFGSSTFDALTRLIPEAMGD